MESHAVVLVDLDRLSTEREIRAAYVGMSRAKYALHILAGPEAAARLGEVLA
jgi:superfamily I DNA/RNA helicase